MHQPEPTHNTPPDTYRLQKSHFFYWKGWEKNSNPRNERKDPPQRKTRQQIDEDPKSEKKSSTDLNAELRRRPAAQQIEGSPLVDWEGWQEHSNRRKEKRKTSSRASPTGKTKSTRKSELKTMKLTWTAANKSCTDLPPNGLTQLLFVAERRTTHRWKACLLADTKRSRSTVSERQGQRKRYSNPARSSIHSEYRPRPRIVQCTHGSGCPIPSTRSLSMSINNKVSSDLLRSHPFVVVVVDVADLAWMFPPVIFFLDRFYCSRFKSSFHGLLKIGWCYAQNWSTNDNKLSQNA